MITAKVFLTAARCNQRCSTPAAIPAVTMEGRVPSPKHSMVKAPEKGLPLAAANNKTEYTMPQGSQPHTMPIISALVTEFTGSKRFPRG